MYGPLRDLFCEVLGYPRGSVLIDIAGEAGRPDVTCRAPSGINDRGGKSLEVDWMVVEAKDERDAFSTIGKREAIFAQKAKYIRPDTAWFVMVDPTVIVARPVMSAQLNSISDIVFALDDHSTEADFRAAFTRLSYGVAGVPQRLKQFREGDVSLIATEKLSAPDKPDKRRENQVLVARRNFYETLRNTTGHLQESTLGTLQSVLGMATDISASWDAFHTKYAEAVFDPYTLTVSAKPGSYELAMSYGGDVVRLNRKLKKAGSIARLALDGLPQFTGGAQSPAVDGWHITLSGYMLDWVKVPDEQSALGLAQALFEEQGWRDQRRQPTVSHFAQNSIAAASRTPQRRHDDIGIENDS